MNEAEANRRINHICKAVGEGRTDCDLHCHLHRHAGGAKPQQDGELTSNVAVGIRVFSISDVFTNGSINFTCELTCARTLRAASVHGVWSVETMPANAHLVCTW